MTIMSGHQYLGTQMYHLQYPSLGNNGMVMVVVVVVAAARAAQWHCLNIVNENNNLAVTEAEK